MRHRRKTLSSLGATVPLPALLAKYRCSGTVDRVRTANTPDVLDLLDCSIVEVAEQLAHVWDDFMDVEMTVEEDADGVWHALVRSTPCRPPQRVALVTLRALVSAPLSCPRCWTGPSPSMRPFDQLVAARTLSLRLAVATRSLPDASRAQAMVQVLWGGSSRFCPEPVFSRLRREVLLPGVFDLGRRLRAEQSVDSGMLVAFTLGDMRLGAEEDPYTFDLFAQAAAASLVHASPGDGVWLLHAPSQYVPALQRSGAGMGKILERNCRRDEIDAQACEVFGVLCDDAVAGCGDWADIYQWWSAAKLLSAQRSQ
jgi:hypothetical protein